MYDLAVVGAGPAGSSAARKASQLGLTTILIDKEHFPRYKPCGGAVSEQALSYLDFDIPEQMIERNIYGARVHYKDQVIECRKTYRIAVLIQRTHFDHYLLNKAEEAGSKIMPGNKVRHFRQTEKNVELELSSGKRIQARYLLIAEGMHGPLAGKIRGNDPNDKYGICAVTEHPERPDVINDRLDEVIDIYFGNFRMGYGWIFSFHDHLSVGIGGIASFVKRPDKLLHDFMQTNQLNPASTLHVHCIPLGGIKRKLGNRRILLCGDSAGFVDAFYGEGIAYAIRSGQLAASCISRSISDPSFRLVDTYYRKCNEDFGLNLKNSLYLSRMMHRFPGLFFGIFTRYKAILHKYLEVPAVRIIYKDYLKWLTPRVPFYITRLLVSKLRSLLTLLIL